VFFISSGYAGLVRIGCLLLLVAALLARGVPAAAQRAPSSRIDFDAETIGRAPQGFTFAESRDARPGRWSIRAQPSGAGQLLVHAPDGGTAAGHALALVNGLSLHALDIAVRLRLLEGGRSGGLVWRYQDPSNYHVVQLTLGKQEIGLYRVVNGNRVRLEVEDDVELDPAAWHTLRVVQRSRSVRVYLGGIRVFEDRDRTPAPDGSAGVWSAGDTLAEFDDLRVAALEDRD
jgi:hypothetical protein